MLKIKCLYMVYCKLKVLKEVVLIEHRTIVRTKSTFVLKDYYCLNMLLFSGVQVFSTNEVNLMTETRSYYRYSDHASKRGLYITTVSRESIANGNLAT